MHLFSVVLAALESLADEYGGEVGEDEGLEECHQHFDEINKYGKRQRHR